jgi:hypothetical protein
MAKLWSFGCSHTAGYELGNKGDYMDWFARFGDKRPEQWYKSINYITTPELAWAGRLADKLNIEHVSKARNGNGIDRCMVTLTENNDNIDWDNDIVVLGCPPPGRWISMTNDDMNVILGDIEDDIMYGTVESEKKVSYWIEHLPKIDTQEMFHVGVLTLIKKMYPKVKFIKMYNNNYMYEDMSIYANNTPLMDIPEKYNIDNPKYPGGHYIEEVHEKLAIELIKTGVGQ